MKNPADRYNADGSIKRVTRDQAPLDVRPDETDPIPDELLPPRRLSRRWNQERLGTTRDRDD